MLATVEVLRVLSGLLLPRSPKLTGKRDVELQKPCPQGCLAPKPKFSMISVGTPQQSSMNVRRSWKHCAISYFLLMPLLTVFLVPSQKTPFHTVRGLVTAGLTGHSCLETLAQARFVDCT